MSLFTAMLIAGAAGKLGWDAINRGGLIIDGIVAAIALGLVVYAVIEYFVGRRILRVELSRFRELQAIRAQLHLDDPASLLPSR